MTSSCECPQGAGALWEHQCCPTGFMVADKVTWQSKSQADVDSIRLSLVYDSSTTNELDASYYCKTCPGISHEDWMSPDALYKACSGPTRGTCEPVVGKLELSCNCKINAVTKNRWLGRACACDESIPIPYSTDASNAESTDYGCLYQPMATASVLLDQTLVYFSILHECGARTPTTLLEKRLVLPF